MSLLSLLHVKAKWPVGELDHLWATELRGKREHLLSMMEELVKNSQSMQDRMVPLLSSLARLHQDLKEYGFALRKRLPLEGFNDWLLAMPGKEGPGGSVIRNNKVLSLAPEACEQN